MSLSLPLSQLIPAFLMMAAVLVLLTGIIIAINRRRR